VCLHFFVVFVGAYSGEFLVEDLVGLKAMRASRGTSEGAVVGTVVGVVTRDEVRRHRGKRPRLPTDRDRHHALFTPASFHLQGLCFSKPMVRRRSLVPSQVCSLDDTSLGHDLLEIAVPGGRNRGSTRTCLVPLVPALVAAVDVARGVLWLDDGDANGEVLEGLLELAVEPTDKTRIRATMPELALSLQTPRAPTASKGATSGPDAAETSEFK
jgi:hypothetical protein